MAGIAGWVDFERDLSRERSTVLTMTATLAARGPDGEGVWVSPHAAFGHRRTAVFDLEDGRQPVLVREDGRLIAAGMHSGSILNHAELRDTLSAAGHKFRTGGDTEVLVHAYLEWGPDCARRLEGTFAGAVWDERKRELWLVRDRLGVEPLFYYRLPTGMVFGSELKAVLAHPMVDRVVDADGLREVVTYSGTPRMAFFKGMDRLRGGRMLTLRPAGLEVRQYWAIEAAPHTDSLDKTVETVRGLLGESVERNLRADVPVGVLLSGGLDSSAVTAMADQTVRKEGGRVRTFTVDFERHADNFRPNDTRSARDAPYSADVVEHLDTDHLDVVLDPAELIDPVVRSAVLRAKDFPTALGDMNTSLHLLARAVAGEAGVVLTGEAADSLFHGVGWNRVPAEANMGTFPWVARGVVKDNVVALGCELFDKGVIERLDPLGYAAERYRESVAEAPHLPESEGVDRHMRELCWVHLTNFMELQNAHTERLFKMAGLEVRMPFCDQRMVQYAYNLPWDVQNFDGREKGVLRSAVRDLLPRSVIDRRKSPYPVTADPVYENALRTEMAALIADPNAPVRPLLDVPAVSAAVKNPDAWGNWVKRANAELPIQLNTWLRDYGIRLDF